MKRRKLAIGLVAALPWATVAVCETHLSNPAPVHVCSKYFCVDSIPGADTLLRCIHQPDSDRCHWSIPGWHRNILVSDFGMVAVVYDGGNYLPLNYDPETVLIQLWKNGLLVRKIRAKEIGGLRQRRSESHYEWGVVRGFDQNDEIIVSTSAGKRVKIADPPVPSYNYFPASAVDEFKAQWYGRFLDAFKEPSLWELSKKTQGQFYRFTWLRSFHHPVVVRIEVRPDGICELTVKVGLGSGGYDPGMLIQNDSRPLTKQQSQWFLNWVDSRFWNTPAEANDHPGDDGAQWIIEGVENGRYRIEDRWSPKSGSIRELGLAMTGLAGLEIRDEEIY